MNAEAISLGTKIRHSRIPAWGIGTVLAIDHSDGWKAYVRWSGLGENGGVGWIKRYELVDIRHEESGGKGEGA